MRPTANNPRDVMSSCRFPTEAHVSVEEAQAISWHLNKVESGLPVLRDWDPHLEILGVVLGSTAGDWEGAREAENTVV